jgi:hypothetical protein
MSPGFDGLKHRPHVVPTLVGQSHVCRDRLAVELFGLRDLADALGEGLGKVAPGEFQADATGEKRPRVYRVLEERFLPVVRGGEHEQDMRRDRFEEREESADDVRPKAVGFVHDPGAARLRPESAERHFVGDLSDARGRHVRRVELRHVEGVGDLRCE